MERLDVLKTYKLYINGAFPRTESGRSIALKNTRGKVIAHICHGSRKDLRNAVEAARAAQEKWAGRDAYNRGQILYRMAEMMEGKRDEFAEAIRVTGGATAAAARKEVAASIDRLVCFAGWCDKFAQVLGGHNPVAGPHYNFTIPEPTGVVGVVAPDEPALLGLITLIGPAICAGNTVVAIASQKHPLPAAVFGEVCATSDVPSGVVNIITGKRAELLEHLARHREVDAISAANLRKNQAAILRAGMAENLKRVSVRKLNADDWHDADAGESPWAIEPVVEMKTIWHPSAS
ncbi:MAG: aldehyde dehydrogenase family protein [Phycisphaerales bacterium]|nr:MAG: aldehyde dehydrogenase family protein [Phycisphaerales bacterium]